LLRPGYMPETETLEASRNGDDVWNIVSDAWKGCARRLAREQFQISTRKHFQHLKLVQTLHSPNSSQTLPNLFVCQLSQLSTCSVCLSLTRCPGDLRTLGQWVAPPCFNGKVSDCGKVLANCAVTMITMSFGGQRKTCDDKDKQVQCES
jgi:hypothetical protein